MNITTTVKTVKHQAKTQPLIRLHLVDPIFHQTISYGYGSSATLYYYPVY